MPHWLPRCVDVELSVVISLMSCSFRVRVRKLQLGAGALRCPSSEFSSTEQHQHHHPQAIEFTMAARSVTPGGALLRTSRMFALPAPIPPPPETNLGNKGSKSKTVTFPTHQIITTTNASRKRGDWGLKRPLPLRATTKSTYAMLRVNQMDSIEAITDYSSATDLGITLRKFQELHLPITVAEERNVYQAYTKLPRSVFEEDRDFTAIDPAERAALVDKRWKFSGPWLAGMGQGEFRKWIEKTVRPKRSEFREFLKQKLAQETVNKKMQKAMDAGETPAPIAPDTAAISDGRLIQYLRVLRNNRAQLYDMVGQFLDLAPLQPPSAESEGKFSNLAPPSGSPYSARGPPVTHPSAGISYLRTAMFMDNHPFYGPQKEHAPVEARVVKPRRPGFVGDAKVGIAGFITDAPQGDTHSNQRDMARSASIPNPDGHIWDRIDTSKKGGHKVFVQAREATVNSRGGVEITISDADTEAYLVAQELLGAEETKTFRRPAATPRVRDRKWPDRSHLSKNPRMSSAGGYGLGSNTSYKSLYSPKLPKQ